MAATLRSAVIDRGAGIEPKQIDTIFNPFFTTKPDGVGLGLAICSKIVDQHGGKIAVESEQGKGSVFRVYLPHGGGRIRIETERLNLSPWEADDWLEFRSIAADPDVMRYIGDGQPWPEERVAAIRGAPDRAV